MFKINLYTYLKKVLFPQHGVAALLTIILIAAATLIIAYSASILGLGELDLGYTSQKGGEAFSLADGCLEETLERIRLDVTYGLSTGTIDLPTSNGNCTIDVTDLGNNQRKIWVTGNVITATSRYTKKIQAEITVLNNIITNNSWQELSD